MPRTSCASPRSGIVFVTIIHMIEVEGLKIGFYGLTTEDTPVLATTGDMTFASSVDTGIAPPMSFSSNKHLGTDAVIRVEVKDGEFVTVGDFVSP